ncbi:hypothetical protein E2562_036582 [Oryza meyeriana var. granulata]|uniref:Uncharacterized protein n=1 Tax=Oryza meyeriana var. granulata TaxID=110450 RepID=A0A6G1ETB3_9ORYZ|nr:hypothetical protein E2562_036582 [Oryza meyeriana var. granulata]
MGLRPGRRHRGGAPQELQSTRRRVGKACSSVLSSEKVHRGGVTRAPRQDGQASLRPGARQAQSKQRHCVGELACWKG